MNKSTNHRKRQASHYLFDIVDRHRGNSCPFFETQTCSKNSTKRNYDWICFLQEDKRIILKNIEMQLIYASIRTSYIILTTHGWGFSYRSVRPCSQGLRRCPWPCSACASAARRRTMPPPRLPSGRSTRRRSTPAPWSYPASSWSRCLGSPAWS